MSGTEVFRTQLDGKQLNIQIKQIYTGNYGLTLWPSAKVLSSIMCENTTMIKGKTILELGCGPGLAGIVAAKCGGNVYLSDKRFPSIILTNCEENCVRNEVSNNTHILPIDWGEVDDSILELPPIDLIIATDVIYDTKSLDDLLFSISFITTKSPECKLLMVFPERVSMETINKYITNWDMQASCVFVDDMDNHAQQMIILYTNGLLDHLYS